MMTIIHVEQDDSVTQYDGEYELKKYNKLIWRYKRIVFVCSGEKNIPVVLLNVVDVNTSILDQKSINTLVESNIPVLVIDGTSQEANFIEKGRSLGMDKKRFVLNSCIPVHDKNTVVIVDCWILLHCPYCLTICLWIYHFR